MRKKKLLLLISIILIGCMFYGCPEDNPTIPKDDNIKFPEENVTESKTTTIGTSGGSVSLSDGSSVTIGSGGVSTETKVVVSKISNDNYFSGSNRTSIDISSDGAISGMTIKIKVKAGLTKEQVGVFRYNPATAENSEILTGDNPDFEYDSQTGYITSSVTAGVNGTKRENVQGSLLFPRWIAEWDENVEGKSSTKIIEMPFYEQPGSACWATCALMLTKAYTPNTDRTKESEVYNYLKYLQLGRDDGIYCYQFLRTLPKAFHLYSGGAGVEATGFFRTSAMREKIISEIDKDHPVIISLSYPGVGQHAIMVIGYTKKTSGSGSATYDLHIHNPQGTGSETMYTTHDFDWFFKDKSATTAVQILYSTNAVHPDRTLLTLGMPLRAVGHIKFKVPFKQSSYNIELSEDIASSKGYKWVWSGKTMEAIPDSASALLLNLPIWNADRSSSKSAKLEIRVYCDGKLTYQHDESISVGAMSTAWFRKEIPINDIRKDNDSAEYMFKFDLYDGGTYADGFDFYVNIENAHPLNGIWLWDITPISDGCGVLPDGDDFEFTMKVSKTSITLIGANEEEIFCDFMSKGDDFTIFFKESGGDETMTIDGKMTGTDSFTAYIYIEDIKIIYNTEYPYEEISREPCTSTGTIDGTRVK